MWTVRNFIRQHAKTSAFALVLALLLSVGWGQVHRVLHPGAQAYAVVDATDKAIAPDEATASSNAIAFGLGDEDGSDLCKLLDHLTHGAGPAAVLSVSLGGNPPVWIPFVDASRLYVEAILGFDARGPPQLT